MLDIANPGTPLPKGKTIGSRDQAQCKGICCLVEVCS